MALKSTETKKVQIDRFEERHKDDLSASTYAKKTAGSFFTSLLTMGGGAAAGFGIGGLFKSKTFLHRAQQADGFVEGVTGASEVVESRVPKILEKVKLSQAVGALAGAVIGSIGYGIYEGYQNWRENEAQRLATMDVNNDITQAKILIPSDKELLDQNKHLKEMLLKEEKHTAPTTQIDADSITLNGKQETQALSASIG